MSWYKPNHPNEIASPALLIFPERVKQNIEYLIEIAGDVGRLRPHVKTHKLPQIVKMHQKYGIDKMKCATIAEAEMVAMCGVADILLAYQPVGPNQQRLIKLARAYPDCQFGCLLDNETTLRQLTAQLRETAVMLNIWIDIDNGNGRSGIQPSKTAENLAKLISDAPQLSFAGLHVYDGHFAHLPIEDRINKADAAFAPVHEMVQQLAVDDLIVHNIVAGGSPTFPVHAKQGHARQTNLDLSPGTYTLWDIGYATLCPELPFVHAAVLLCRVISKPISNRLCLDLGHKAVAAENPLDNRVRFLNAPDAIAISQNEEHLVIELPNAADFAVGDVLYGVPWHICPSVALHQEAIAIDANGDINGRWPIAARNRRLKI